MDDSEDHPTHQIRSVSVSSLNVPTSAPSYAVVLPGNDSIVIRNPTSLRPSLTNETGVFRTDVDAILRRTIHQLRVQQGPVDRESALFGVRVLRVGTVLCL